MGRRPKRGQEFVTGIDDSGGHAALFEPNGKRIVSPNQPLVGVASVSVSRPLLGAFERAWDRLRARIQSELGLAEPPPIHVRWMWGAKRADPHKNPYLHASQEQVAEWLAEAVKTLVHFQGQRYQFGILAEFYPRAHMQDLLEPFYSDASTRVEHIYLASRLVPKDLYRIYHRATMYPLLRTMPYLFWQLDASVKNIGGKSTSIVMDAFTGTEGVEAPEVLRATQDLAQLTRLDHMAVVDNYADSALVQAADVIAWSYNRVATQGLSGTQDMPFLKVFGPILRAGRSLAGTTLDQRIAKPQGTSSTTLCIVYSLARGAIEKQWPDFVEENFVDVDEFHKRAQAAYDVRGYGISVLTESAKARAQEYAATRNDRAAV